MPRRCLHLVLLAVEVLEVEVLLLRLLEIQEGVRLVVRRRILQLSSSCA